MSRARSKPVEAAVLEAATALLSELRPSEITSEAIAARAQVSKATLYKRWPSKTHVLLDAILIAAGETIPLPDTGSALNDFSAAVTGFVRFHTESDFGVSVAHLFAEGLNDPGLMTMYREKYAEPRRVVLREIWRRGVERGELSAHIDPDLALDAFYGPLLYRFFLGHGPITVEFAQMLVECLFSGFARQEPVREGETLAA